MGKLLKNLYVRGAKHPLFFLRMSGSLIKVQPKVVALLSKAQVSARCTHG